MGIVQHVLLPPFVLPFRFLLGRRCLDNPHELPCEEYDDSDVESACLDEEVREVMKRQLFVNHEFGNSFRSTPVDDSDLFQYARKTPEYRRLGSVKALPRKSPALCNTPATELSVDVSLQPSAFAFHMVPYETDKKAFCCRDDSEIATKSVIIDYDDDNDLEHKGLASQDLHANCLYLSNKSAFDDMEIGLFTEGKTPLRAIGAAVVYKTELSGRDSQLFSDYRSQYSPSPCLESEACQLLKSNSFRDRNKMVRLESIVGRAQTPQNSFVEFGVMDSRGGEFLERKFCRSASCRSASRTPQPEVLPSSNGGKRTTLNSYPLSFLSRLPEEELSDDENTEQVESTPEPPQTVAKLRAVHEEYRSLSRGNRRIALGDTPQSGRLSRRFKIKSFDLENDGVKNPFYEFPEELYPGNYWGQDEDEDEVEDEDEDRKEEMVPHEKNVDFVTTDFRSESRTGNGVLGYSKNGESTNYCRILSTREFLLEQYLAMSAAGLQDISTNV